jgi:hypothetical protein
MLPTRGIVFIGLNVVRTLSIIALLLVFSSSIVVLVNDVRAVNRFIADGEKADLSASNSTSTSDHGYISGSTVPHQPAGLFWAVLNRLLIIGQTVVLLLSEAGIASRFFERFFPVLGRGFGLGPTGLIQCLIGAAILSHHVEQFTLVSAFFLFSVGCINILAGLVWRESTKARRSLTEWRESKEDGLPRTTKDLRPMAMGSQRMLAPPPSYHKTGSSIDEKSGTLDPDIAPAVKWSGYGFGRQGEKVAAKEGFSVSKPVEAIPR